MKIGSLCVEFLFIMRMSLKDLLNLVKKNRVLMSKFGYLILFLSFSHVLKLVVYILFVCPFYLSGLVRNQELISTYRYVRSWPIFS